MLLANNKSFTLERNADGQFILTNLATGEVMALTESDFYPLNDVIIEALEVLEFEAAKIELAN